MQKKIIVLSIFFSSFVFGMEQPKSCKQNFLEKLRLHSWLFQSRKPQRDVRKLGDLPDMNMLGVYQNIMMRALPRINEDRNKFIREKSPIPVSEHDEGFSLEDTNDLSYQTILDAVEFAQKVSKPACSHPLNEKMESECALFKQAAQLFFNTAGELIQDDQYHKLARKPLTCMRDLTKKSVDLMFDPEEAKQISEYRE